MKIFFYILMMIIFPFTVNAYSSITLTEYSQVLEKIEKDIQQKYNRNDIYIYSKDSFSILKGQNNISSINVREYNNLTFSNDEYDLMYNYFNMKTGIKLSRNGLEKLLILDEMAVPSAHHFNNICLIFPPDADKTYQELITSFIGKNKISLYDIDINKLSIPKDIFIRYIIYHEIGHCLDSEHFIKGISFDKNTENVLKCEKEGTFCEDAIKDLSEHAEIRHSAESFADIFSIINLYNEGVDKDIINEISHLRNIGSFNYGVKGTYEGSIYNTGYLIEKAIKTIDNINNNTDYIEYSHLINDINKIDRINIIDIFFLHVQGDTFINKLKVFDSNRYDILNNYYQKLKYSLDYFKNKTSIIYHENDYKDSFSMTINNVKSNIRHKTIIDAQIEAASILDKSRKNNIYKNSFSNVAAKSIIKKPHLILE